jgi:predicted RND superfamily exporter protein
LNLTHLFKFIIKRPIFSVFIITVFVGFLASYAPLLKIDASSQTLLLDNDKAFNFSKKISQRYATSDFLVVAFEPNEPLFTPKTDEILKNLSNELESLEHVASITSILNVPLLQSPIRPIKEMVKGVQTWSDSGLDAALVKEEFLTSPLYKKNLVSEDLSTTSLLIFLKDDYPNQRDIQRKIEHENIKQVRAVLEKYEPYGNLYLGGVSMIVDDLITYIKHDILFYGSALFLLLGATLYFIFRQIRWVVLPILVSAYSVVATVGILGYFGWEVTVVSSNFIALQLIVTLSIIIHLIVRYRELSHLYPKARKDRLILLSMLSKIAPTFFSIITTVAGFAALIFSNIKPIISLGWMMSLGISVSLLIGYTLFGAFVSLLPKIKPIFFFENRVALASWCSKAVEKRGVSILLITVFIFLVSVIGGSKLEVENSFINYFKSSTQIYKGMEIIDKKLGGTTPLDIIITFENEKKSEEEELDPFEAEFAQTKDEARYWFSAQKMRIIEEVHDYLESTNGIGAVQSMGTLLKIGKILNKDRDLDSFEMALLYNELPDRFKNLILNPYLSIEDNQLRFSTRVMDSMQDLRRDALLKKIDNDLTLLLKDSGAKVELTSLMVLYNNLLQSLFESQIRTLGIVIFALGIMFWMLFRNIQVATIALLANIVPISTIFGFMGWLGLPLDMMTITIAAISIGIGVDDTIHYLHRFFSELNYDGDYLKAMQRSHEGVGYAMYYTSFIVILGFSILVVSNFIPTIYFGLLTVLVMAIALLGALLLLPKLVLLVKPWKRKHLRRNYELSS